jgi:hypothetical protein
MFGGDPGVFQERERRWTTYGGDPLEWRRGPRGRQQRTEEQRRDGGGGGSGGGGSRGGGSRGSGAGGGGDSGGSGVVLVNAAPDLDLDRPWYPDDDREEAEATPEPPAQTTGPATGEDSVWVQVSGLVDAAADAAKLALKVIRSERVRQGISEQRSGLKPFLDLARALQSLAEKGPSTQTEAAVVAAVWGVASLGLPLGRLGDVLSYYDIFAPELGLPTTTQLVFEPALPAIKEGMAGMPGPYDDQLGSHRD